MPLPSAWPSVPLEPDEVTSLVHGMRDYYDERANQYDDWYLHINLYDDPQHNAAWQAELDQMTGWISAFGHGRLLELASGTGWWTRHLARNARVTTLDYAPSMIEVLRARLRAEGLTADITCGDAYHLPFTEGAFDCCFFGFWLSHVPFALLDEFFGELRRVVRPGGRVMLVDSKPFRGEQPAKELNQQRRLNDGSSHQIVKIYHTPETLHTLLSSYGHHVSTRATPTFFTAGEFDFP